MSPGPWLFLQVSTMHQFNHLFIYVQWYISKFSSKCLNFLLVCNKHHCVVFHSCLYRCMCRVIHITVYLIQEINSKKLNFVLMLAIVQCVLCALCRSYNFSYAFLFCFSGHQEHHFLAFVKQVIERSNYSIFIYYLRLLITLSNRKCSLLCHSK